MNEFSAIAGGGMVLAAIVIGKIQNNNGKDDDIENDGDIDKAQKEVKTWHNVCILTGVISVLLMVSITVLLPRLEDHLVFIQLTCISIFIYCGGNLRNSQRKVIAAFKRQTIQLYKNLENQKR